LHRSIQRNLLSETYPATNAYLVSQQYAGFILDEARMKMILITAAMFSAMALTPASAMMMACTGDNMAKSTAMMATGQTAANKEMAMANADMSNGKMRSACMHYMKAQKMSMAK
jgi:hypothetical protein